MMTQTKQAIGNDSSNQIARPAVILGSTLLDETWTLCVNRVRTMVDRNLGASL